MRDRLALAGYVCGVLLATSIHDIRFLLGGLVAVLALSGRDLPVVARRAALSIVVFNSIVTVAYVGASLLRGGGSGYYVALINVRVFLLTSLTFLVARRVNLWKALAFSRTLTYVLALAATQTLTFRRLFEEFRMAFRSRSIGRPSVRDLYRHAASTGAFFLDRSLESVTEVAQAMKSRGFFRA